MFWTHNVWDVDTTLPDIEDPESPEFKPPQEDNVYLIRVNKRKGLLLIGDYAVQVMLVLTQGIDC